MLGDPGLCPVPFLLPHFSWPIPPVVVWTACLIASYLACDSGFMTASKPLLPAAYPPPLDPVPPIETERLKTERHSWHRSRTVWARRWQIMAFGIRFGWGLQWDRWRGQTPTRQRQRAQWAAQQVLKLGPTFIKIGQALSTRVDLIPVAYVESLAQLQDNVPPFSGAEAIAIIEAELGTSIRSLYRDFESQPLAAASLGQVHKAQLHTGETVVVKVQRPGLENLFALDLKALRGLLQMSARWMEAARYREVEAIYSEFFSILYQEIDYIQEGKNADRFRENFKDQPRILVPEIFWRYTTTKVLTMSYLPGIKINDRSTLESCGLDLKEINYLGISCYLQQLLQDGFFQADPHPGNMAVTPEGSIIFYDFGMMAEVAAIDKDQMIKTFFAVLRKDTPVLVETLIDLGLLERTADMTPVHRMATFILDKFTERPIDVYAFGEMRGEIVAMFEQQPFRLPPQMTFVIKSLTTLDGIARVLDPDYNLLKAAQPFVKQFALQDRKGILGELARQTRSLVTTRLQRPHPAQTAVERLQSRLEAGDLTLRVRSTAQERQLRRISLMLKSLMYTCWTGFTLVTAAILLTGGQGSWAIAAFVMAALGAVGLLRCLVEVRLRENLDRLAE